MSLRKPANRRQTVGNLYSAAENGRVPRDISFDETGVKAFVGSQGTNELWYGERIEVEDEGVTLRVLKISPSKSKGMQFNRQTGRPEFGTRMTACRYVIGDVTIPLLNNNTSLGRVLRAVQERFRPVQQSPLDHGNINGDRACRNLYERWFIADG